MKVILRDNVRKVGHKYDVVTVADGYALNYLIPNRLADIASPGALARIDSVREKANADLESSEQALAELIASLPDTVSYTGKANEQGHLFAKVGTHEVAEALTAAAGKQVPESAIMIKDLIKEVGEHDVILASKNKKRTITLIVEAGK